MCVTAAAPRPRKDEAAAAAKQHIYGAETRFSDVVRTFLIVVFDAHCRKSSSGVVVVESSSCVLHVSREEEKSIWLLRARGAWMRCPYCFELGVRGEREAAAVFLNIIYQSAHTHT